MSLTPQELFQALSSLVGHRPSVRYSLDADDPEETETCDAGMPIENVSIEQEYDQHSFVLFETETQSEKYLKIQIGFFNGKIDYISICDD